MTMNKQRPDRSIAGFIPAIVVLIAFLISMIYFGMRTAYNVIGLGFWAVGIIQLICYTKTRSTGYLNSTLYLAFIGTFVFSLDIDVLLRGEKLSNTSALLGVITLFLIPAMGLLNDLNPQAKLTIHLMSSWDFLDFLRRSLCVCLIMMGIE